MSHKEQATTATSSSKRQLFSLNASDIGNRYTLAKRLDKTIASVVRQDLKCLETMIDMYEQSARRDPKIMALSEEVIRALSGSGLCRIEGPTTVDDVRAYLVRVGKENLLAVLEKEPIRQALQTAWLINRARSLAAGI